MLDHVDPQAIADPALRTLVLELLNLLDRQASQIEQLTAENQRLRDEINRLKGAQGRPHVGPSAPARPAPLSSEAERRMPTPRQPRAKQAELTITREQVCTLDRATLPADAQFK